MLISSPAKNIAVPTATSNTGGHASVPVHVNLPARVLGWEQEGGAKVELLSHIGEMPMGTVVSVKLMPPPPGRQPIDFDFHRKHGLRTGGIVLLRKAAIEGPDVLCARGVEPLLHRERDGLAYILQGAASCVLPPPPGTRMVSDCLVAFVREAVEGPGDVGCLEKARQSIEQACLFGYGGILLTGETQDGSAIEVLFGGDEKRTADKLVTDFLTARPREVAAEARRSKRPWHLVAFFRGEVDPDRSSKISAQRANFDYGLPDEPMWNVTNAVLRSYAESWLVSDVTPTTDVAVGPTRFMLDILED